MQGGEYYKHVSALLYVHLLLKLLSVNFSVRKGFALIFGMLLSGIFQASGTGIRTHQVVGGLLAATSLWMHTTHPYKHPPAKDAQK